MIIHPSELCLLTATVCTASFLAELQDRQWWDAAHRAAGAIVLAFLIILAGLFPLT